MECIHGAGYAKRVTRSGHFSHANAHLIMKKNQQKKRNESDSQLLEGKSAGMLLLIFFLHWKSGRLLVDET